MGKTTTPIEASQVKEYSGWLWNKTERGDAYWISKKAEALMVMIAIDTGYRISDLLAITWDDCEETTIGIAPSYAINIIQKKTNEPMSNKVSPHTANLMNEYKKVLESEGIISPYVLSNKDGKPFHRQWAIKRMKIASANKRFGNNATEGVGVHSLRKAAAIRMLNAPNGTIEKVSKYLGHKSVRVTEEYLKVNEKAQAQWQDEALGGF